MDLFGAFWSHLAVVLEWSFRDPVRGHGIVPHGCGPSLFGVYAGMILVARAGMLGRNRGAATEQQQIQKPIKNKLATGTRMKRQEHATNNKTV